MWERMTASTLRTETANAIDVISAVAITKACVFGSSLMAAEKPTQYPRRRCGCRSLGGGVLRSPGRDGQISGDVVNRVRHDLDLEDARLDI